ncbi:hypothetical protein HZS_1512 [Henneguya salminicola]|nr:hypothetical protein HZS_1512 [Henneguya salminicola]
MTRGSPLINDIRARIIEAKQLPKNSKVFDKNRTAVHNIVDENCTTSLKTISKKSMPKFGVKISKSTAANILTRFS